MNAITWNRRPWMDGAVAIAGCVYPLGFAPFEYRVVTWLSLLILFMSFQGVSAKRAALRGWLWGLGAFLVGVYWVYNSMHDFGGAPPIAAAIFTLIFAMYLAIYPALTGGVWSRFYADKPFWAAGLALGLLWGLCEWLRAWVLTGFPWLMSGYSLMDTPLAAYMPVIGSFGISALAAVVVGYMALAIIKPKKSRVGLTLINSIILLLGGALLSHVSWQSTNAKTLDVVLVQGNVPQEVKLRSEYLNVSLEAYYELSRDHFDADLIIWPETAMPTYRYALQGFLNKVAKDTADKPATVFTGIFSRAENGRDYYNAMLEIGGEWQEYRKHQLVPFGEYMPVRWVMQIFSAFVDIPKSDMASAPLATQPLKLAGANIATSICYEMAYPDVLRAQIGEADLMVNTSNDAWFGDSFAAHQHLEMARVRAKEFAKPIARATNNGITVFIDESGVVLNKSEQFVPLVLRSKLSLGSNNSIYTQFGQIRLVGALLVLLILLFFAYRSDLEK